MAKNQTNWEAAETGEETEISNSSAANPAQTSSDASAPVTGGGESAEKTNEQQPPQVSKPEDKSGKFERGDRPNVDADPENPWPRTPTPPPPTIPKPEPETDAEDDTPVDSTVELSSDINKARALLNSTKARKVKNNGELKQRTADVRRLEKHIFSLQQGLPKLIIGASEFARGHRGHAESVKEHRIRILAAQNSDVKELVDANEALIKRLNAMRESLELVTVERDGLKKTLQENKTQQ